MVGYAAIGTNQTIQEKSVTNTFYLDGTEQRLSVPAAVYPNVTEYYQAWNDYGEYSIQKNLSFYCCNITTTVHVYPSLAVNYSSDNLARKFIKRPQLTRAVPATITAL
jgi:hypothetical protein